MRRRASRRRSSAACADTGTAIGARISTRHPARPHEQRAVRHRTARAEDHDRHDRHLAAHRGGERADVEALESRHLVERALREEHQRVALLGAPQHAHRVAPPAALAVPVDELRADALQQEPGQRHRGRLALDHEREARRQRRLHDDAVEVARVVRDHDARCRAAAARARRPTRRTPSTGSAVAREAMRDARVATSRLRHDQRQHRGEHEQQAEDGQRAHAVGGRERARQRAAHRWNLGQLGRRSLPRRAAFCELVPVMLTAGRDL